MSNVQEPASGQPSITPHLVIRGAAEAIEFYKQAFGAVETSRLASPDGQGVLHASLTIGNGQVFVCDESRFMERWVSPKSLNGTTVAIHIQTDDADRTFERAVKAGARVAMPLTDMFWGDRYGRVTDPFGHEWSIAQHVKDVSPEEMAKAAAEMARAGKPS